MPTVVTLDKVFLNAAADLSDVCSFEYAGEAINVTTASRAQVRQLVNRRRIVRTGTRTYDSFSVDLPRCTSAQVEWLRDHVGTLLCIRDHVGNKVYAMYADLPREISTAYYDRTAVKLSLDEITASEAV